MERQPAAIIVKPINPAAASEVTGLPEDALKKHFHGSKGALSGRFTDEDLATLAAHVEGLSQAGITPDQLEVRVGKFGKRRPGGLIDVTDVREIAPTVWQGQLSERQRRAAMDAGSERVKNAEQPGNPEQGERLDQRVARGAGKRAQRAKEYLDAEHEQHVQNPDHDPKKGKQVEFVIKGIIAMVIEMIPGGIGPWGIGDIATALEAVAGRTIDGLKLSMKERLIYFGASAIPVVPARPILEAYRWIDRKRREQNQRQLPPPQQ